MSLLWGPSSVLALIVLALSYKKVKFAELIIPVETFSMGIMLVVMNLTNLIEEKNYLFRQYSMLIFLASYFVLCFFLTASWLIGFLLRVPTVVLTISA